MIHNSTYHNPNQLPEPNNINHPRQSAKPTPKLKELVLVSSCVSQKTYLHSVTTITLRHTSTSSVSLVTRLVLAIGQMCYRTYFVVFFKCFCLRLENTLWYERKKRRKEEKWEIVSFYISRIFGMFLVNGGPIVILLLDVVVCYCVALVFMAFPRLFWQ